MSCFQGPVSFADDRDEAITKLRESVTRVQQIGGLQGLRLSDVRVSDLSTLDEVDEQFDLCLCSEVLQRLKAEEYSKYKNRLRSLSANQALFVPNGANPSHTDLSGLSGLEIGVLTKLIGKDSAHAT